MPFSVDDLPSGTPDEIKQRVAERPPRVPVFDPILGQPLEPPRPAQRGTPPHRLVAIGDSLTHGFQSGAVFNTDISYPAIIAYELGWLDQYRYPRYPGFGGLPLNIELLLRELESAVGSKVSIWELPLALFKAREFIDRVEDYWERGPGQTAPFISAYNHALAVYGWDLRDALTKSAVSCDAVVKAPNDDAFRQIVENNSERAALRVYPHWSATTSAQTLLQAAEALGNEHDETTECGIETLIVFLGANNALPAVTNLRVAWSDDSFQDLDKKNTCTVWRPSDFNTEFAELVTAVKAINARHVIWCTVPHVTIAPIARGVGDKLEPGSAYFPFYTRPWIRDADFNRLKDPNITGATAWAVDTAIDMYNDAIQRAVQQARTDDRRDWYLLDIAGLLDRLASRRYITDPNARPDWWTPYPLPAPLAALDPVPDSRFLTGDGNGGRATGGIFSLDGVHPTTVGYGIIAQEMINIMRLAGIEFHHGEGALRSDPVTVDFDRLIQRDTLIQRPPQNLTSLLDVLGWADQTFGWVKRTLNLRRFEKPLR